MARAEHRANRRLKRVVAAVPGRFRAGRAGPSGAGSVRGTVAELGPAHSIHSVNAEKAVSYRDNALEPILEEDSGATVEIETKDASGGQLGANSTVDEVATLDLARVNPVTGPIYVKTAEPGDVLAVEIREFKATNWGWTAIIP